jgi:hypothetical protein
VVDPQGPHRQARDDFAAGAVDVPTRPIADRAFGLAFIGASVHPHQIV